VSGWRSELIQVRCSADEKELWGASAAEAGEALSEWVRRACDARAGLVAAAAESAGSEEPVRGSGGIRPAGAPTAAAPSLDVVSPDRAQDARVGKASFRPDPKAAGVARSRSESASGPCPGDAPAGTKCKLCGQTHK
jgi:hypothetical protein